MLNLLEEEIAMKEKVKVKGQLGIYMQWPLILSALLIIANLLIGAVDTVAGLVMCGFTVIYLLIALWLYFYKRRRMMAGLVEFSADYAWIQKQLLTEMNVPYAVADESGRILWMNQEFHELTGAEKNSRKSLTSVFPEVTKENFPQQDEGTSVHVSLGERNYRIDLKQVLVEENSSREAEETLGAENCQQKLYAVYLFDETEILKYKQEITNQKMVAGLIYLDNYEEALESVEEVRRSLLMALIDRKISKYIAGMNGVVKKLEKDKYFFTIKQQYVSGIQESRFSILEDVKTVNIGNEMSVTLSIGLGMNGETYSQNYDFARMAIDMALGRGGDQAVVKDGEKILYYGGKSQQLEKTTRVLLVRQWAFTGLLHRLTKRPILSSMK